MRATPIPSTLVLLLSLPTLSGCGDDADPESQAATTGEQGAGAETSETDAESEPMLSEPAHYVAFVRGPFISSSIDEQQAVHDAGTEAAREGAMAAGDFFHRGLVSTTLLGSAEGEYLALDQWMAPIEVAGGFYADPRFLEGIGMLISEPPSVDVFEPAPDFYGWGSLEEMDGEAHHKVVVRGRLAGADAESARAAHDQVASSGEESVVAAGDVAHVVFVDPNDPFEIIAVDIWSSPDNLEAVYSDPMFQSGFSAIFDEPPAITVFASTDWFEW